MVKKRTTKERILNTAFELFTSSSYNKISIDDIIKKAGVSKGGLFHHFNSKYDLAREALFYAVKNLWDEPMADLESIKSPYKKLKKLINYSVDIAIKNPKMIKFFIDIHEETLKKGEDAEPWLEFFIQYIETLRKMFDDCKIPNPQIKAMILLVSLDAVGFEAAHFPELEDTMDREQLKHEFYEIFVGNYAKLLQRGD
jgi:AcrR family transcriptional regulator